MAILRMEMDEAAFEKLSLDGLVAVLLQSDIFEEME